MLGPLPRLYRFLVATTALLVCVAGGALAAFVLPYPVLVAVGASVGLAVGALAAFLLVRQTPPAAARGRPVRRTPPR